MLNDFAARFIDGSLSVGATITEHLDCGLTQVTVTFSGPVEAATVDAFGARPHPVVRADWSLSRAVLDIDEEQAATDAWTRVCRDLLSAMLGAAVVADALDMVDCGSAPNLRQASRGFFDCLTFPTEAHLRAMESDAARDVMARARRRTGWLERTARIETDRKAERQALEAKSWAAAKGMRIDPWPLLVTLDSPLLRRLAPHHDVEGSPLSWLATCLEGAASGYHDTDDLLRTCGLQSRSRARVA